MELISRDEAIVMLEDMEGRRDEDGYIRVYKLDVIANLRSLSPIEERKEGEWNFIGWNQFECTCCGYPYTQEQLRAVTTRNDQIFPHFCPNCGAKMKGE